MPKGKRNYRLGGQLTLMRVEKIESKVYEKYIPVPDYILSEWKRALQYSDKVRIARTQNLIANEITIAFRGHATPETIEKINRYFDISRKDFKIKTA